jgi:hypothetical protein
MAPRKSGFSKLLSLHSCELAIETKAGSVDLQHFDFVPMTNFRYTTRLFTCSTPNSAHQRLAWPFQRPDPSSQEFIRYKAHDEAKGDT